MAKREGADVIVASRNVERLDKVAERLNAIAIPADVTDDESIAKLFRACGPVDHVVVTAAQLRTGPFRTVAMEDVRSTMESKFWGAWRVARFADIRPGGSLTLVSGYLSIRPRRIRRSSAPPTARWSHWRGRWRSNWHRCGSMPFRPALSTRPIRAAMPEEARRDMLARTAAALPVGRVGVGEDIARQILSFMANGFATGSIVYIDGGALVT